MSAPCPSRSGRHGTVPILARPCVADATPQRRSFLGGRPGPVAAATWTAASQTWCTRPGVSRDSVWWGWGALGGGGGGEIFFFFFFSHEKLCGFGCHGVLGCENFAQGPAVSLKISSARGTCYPRGADGRGHIPWPFMITALRVWSRVTYSTVERVLQGGGF